MILTGHRPSLRPEREPILLDADVRERLRSLLFEPEFHGVGYSAFIERACEVAETAIAQQRTASGGTRTGRMAMSEPNLSQPEGRDAEAVWDAPVRGGFVGEGL